MVVDAGYSDLPESVVDYVKLCILKTVAFSKVS
jgi:hypothetical protein